MKKKGKGMVDIHSHILFGIDDGPVLLEESVEMARMAAKSGVRHIVAASHGNYYDCPVEEYSRSLKLLQQELSRNQIPVALYPGMEIFVDESAAELLHQKELLTLNHTNYILVEFPFDETPENVCRRIFDLQRRGWHILLAHPERYIFIQNEPELAYFLEECGCVLQINKGSILGEFGKNGQEIAHRFLYDGIAGVIASDAHGTKVRTPSMSRLVAWLGNRFSEREIHIWLSENPGRILKGEKTVGLIRV